MQAPQVSAALSEEIAELTALGDEKDSMRAFDLLAPVLDSGNRPVRLAAMSSVRKQLGRTDVASALTNPKWPLRSRRNLLKAVRYGGDASVVPAVAGRLADANAGIRADAAYALSVLGAERAQPQLIFALADADRDVRYFAADALGFVKTDAARKALAGRDAAETDPLVRFILGEVKKRA
jgi:HEAT repeat protein